MFEEEIQKKEGKVKTFLGRIAEGKSIASSNSNRILIIALTFAALLLLLIFF